MELPRADPGVSEDREAAELLRRACQLVRGWGSTGEARDAVLPALAEVVLVQEWRLAALGFLLVACGSPGPAATVSFLPSPSSGGTSASAPNPTTATQVANSVANSRYRQILAHGLRRPLDLVDIEPGRG